MGETSESRYISCAEDAGLRLKRRRIDLQPAALRLRESGRAPRLDIWKAAGGDQQSIRAHRGAGLQMEDDGRAFTWRSHEWLFDGDTRISDHDHHALAFEVWAER